MASGQWTLQFCSNKTALVSRLCLTLVCNELCNFIQPSFYKGILGEAPHVYRLILNTLISIPGDEAAKYVFHPHRIQNAMCYKRVSFIRPLCAGVTACLIITHSDEVWQGGAESHGAARTGVALSIYFSGTALITFRVLSDKILLIMGLFTERHDLSSTAASWWF